MIKNCVCVSLSPRVEEPNSEVKKLINVRIWTTESPVYFSLPIVFLHMYNVCDGYGYTPQLFFDYYSSRLSIAFFVISDCLALMKWSVSAEKSRIDYFCSYSVLRRPNHFLKSLSRSRRKQVPMIDKRFLRISIQWIVSEEIQTMFFFLGFAN